MSAHPLDRPVWNALTGPQAHLAVGSAAAWRIDPGYGPFAAARDAGAEAQAALAALVRDAGGAEVWLIETAEQPAPPGTRVARTAALAQLVAHSPVPPRDGEAGEPLGEQDAAAMTALAEATQPGPWGPKTRLYGPFHGLRDGARLAAMAGQRLRPGQQFAEVSGVCTWPEYRGQGMAGRMIRQVAAGIVARGDTPFLHSYAGNAAAIGLYQSLGFVIRRELVVTMLVAAD